MTSDSDRTAIGHLAAVLALSRRLESDGLEIFEHHYHHLAFGSWVLILGTRHHRVQLVWDGKEFELHCSVAECTDSQAIVEWTKVRTVRIDSGGRSKVWRMAEELALRFGEPRKGGSKSGRKHPGT